MKNSIVFAIKSLFIIGAGIIFTFFVYSCKTQSGATSQAQTEKMQRTRAKEGQREYRKSYERHLNKQDKDTKKRIKKQIKEQKKNYKERGKNYKVPKKDRSKYACPNGKDKHKGKKKLKFG